MAEDALKTYWDHFFKAETGTYEKSTWLDLFLAEFLIRVNGGANPKELINFCPVSGVVTLVGCELLCGIHRVTSSASAHCASPAPADSDAPTAPETKPEEARVTGLFTLNNAQSSAEVLRKYLLGGVAWRCLRLLQALGVEGLSCCRQLSSVLVWVFGELRGRAPPPPAPAPAHPAPRPKRPPIHQLFSNRIWSKQKPTGGSPGPKISSAAPAERGTTGRSRHVSQSKEPEGKIRRKSFKQTEQSSESADSNDDLQVLNRSLAIKVSPPDDFEYFNSPLRAANDYPNDHYSDPFHTPKKTKPKTDDYMTDKHREVINSEISAFEFTLMITDLLQELCKAESSLSGSEGSQISMQCINFSLKNLCSLQFGSLPACSKQNAQEVSHIKVALTELLIVALDKVLVRADLCAKLINNGVLPMLLRILEDVICKSSTKYHKKTEDQNLTKDDSPSWTESDDMLKYVFGIAYSITAFFHCLLMQCRSVDNLREFTEQFKLYGECLKGGLLRECVELMVRIPGVDCDEVVTLVKKLLDSIGKLINGMKRVRSEVIHSAACPRSRHKACRARVAAGMHHHHDVLGDAGAGLPLAASCCVSVLYGTLVTLLTDEEVSAQAPLRHRILRVMLACGLCCCFSPGLLMENIVRLMLTHGTAAAKCLQVLEHTVYGDLGASVLIPKVTDQLPCSICEPCDEKKFAKKHCLHPVGPVERKSIWSFLIHYNSLLQLDNHNNVLHATVSHLLRVTPKCRLEMKYELLFSVIYPTFIVSKHRYIIRMEESAYFLTVSCLNIFSSLLNTVSFADQFIQKGGLSYVLELVSLPEFSKQCCSILEISIIVEIFKLIKENSETAYQREMSSLASVQMLFKSLSEMTERCFKIYRLKLPEDKFNELCDVSAEREKLTFKEKSRRNSEVPTRTLSMPKAIKTSYASSENVVEDTVEDHIEVLKYIWTFWKSCAGLCLYSPMFRQYVVGEPVFLDSFALLRLLLHALCRGGCGAGEMRVLVKIVEALLIVQFSVSDVTSDRSKEASCGVVRALLSSGAGSGPAGAGCAGGAALRALCEALVRVATAEPSAHHAMPPPPPHAKVPPLLCPSGSSSADGSSSEDSVAAPYASEHSEPYSRADEGYEADVELNKFDLLSSFKARKLSDALSAMDDVPGAESPAGCRQYADSGRLAHPELCVLVLDILTDIIHKLVSSEGSDDSGGGRAAGAALARACCGRLSAALLRAAAPPPPLLRRLLAPSTAALLRDSPDPDLAGAYHQRAAGTRPAGARRARRWRGRAAGACPPRCCAPPRRRRRCCAACWRPAPPRCCGTAPTPTWQVRTIRGQRGRGRRARGGRGAGAGVLRAPVRRAAARRRAAAAAAAPPAGAQHRRAAAGQPRPRPGRCVPSEGSGDAAGGRAAGAALARACCGRLSAALLRAAAPPPPLLRRLLAPSTAALLRDSPDPDLAELQRSILELIHVVASQSITAGELALLLRLLARRSALPALLPALLRLARAAAPAPSVVLAFPVTLHHAGSDQPGPAPGADEAPAALSAAAEAAARAFQEEHQKAGQVSAWAVHAGRCGAEGAGWAPWLQGFALTTWLRRTQPAHEVAQEWKSGEPGAETPGAAGAGEGAPLHVLSIGHDSLLLELWLHTDTGSFTLRLSRPQTSSYKILSETRVDGALPPAQWSCVALNVKEVVHKRRIHIQVTLYIDGCEFETVSLPLQGILVRKITPTHLLVGHAGREGFAGGGYHMSGACVYRAPVLAAAAALHVAAHEPQPPPHLAVQVDNELPNYSRLLTPNVLDSNIDWDQVYDMSGAALRELSENLLLSFSAHAPHIVNLYHQTAALPTVFAGRGGVGKAGAAGGCVPEPLACCWAGRWQASEHHGLAPALLMLGGPHVLLYMFARVVEMEASAEEQAMALGIVLRVCSADNRLRSALHGTGGLDLLLPVFAAPRCKLTYHMLQVILDEACSEPVLSAGAGGLLVGGADAVVREPALLALLLQASRHLDTDEELEWEVELAGGGRAARRGSLWALALSCLQALLEEAPARRWRGFNQQQLHRHDFLRLLLAACKERFLNSEEGANGNGGDGGRGCAGACLVGVVRGLLGAPPPPCHLALLCDLLLLMHQASDTFVTHSRANFYFLLCAEPQDASEFSAALRRRPEPEPHADAKAMKGIINMQIKEARKHNVSSTSENSDQTIETSGGAGESGGSEAAGEAGEGGEEDALNGYVVVDVDDAAHTTVETYSSGIYQEKRVRAGAAPGWTACEGLLLLLRDAILLLSEHDLQQAMQGAIQPEWLVVLANQRDAGVRAAAVRAVAALQRRRVPELAPPARQTLQRHLYRHLANQIALYPGSWELAAACASLITKCDVPLEDQLEDDIWLDVSPEMLQCAAPLLATLPASLHEPPLAHNVSLLVRRIVDKGSLKLVSEMCVPEVAVRCIRELGARGEFDGRALLLDDMALLLARVADKALHSHHQMQIISDMHHMLTYVELTASEGSARAARAAQAALFVAQLDRLEQATASSQRSANYFTTVLSSAVSLGSEGISATELAARHLATVTQAVAFLQARSPSLPVLCEAELVDRLLTTLIAAVSEGAGSRRAWWAGAGSGGDGWLRALRELVWWAGAPAAGVRCLQPPLLRALQAAPHAADLLAPPPPCRQLAVYLLLMLRHQHALAEGGQAALELGVSDWARGWALALQDGLPERLGAALPDEAAALLRADEERWAKAAAGSRLRASIAKVIFAKESLAARLTESAMAATRLVVDAQNGERKAFMELLRRANSAAAAAARRWQRLAEHLTHEQALFHEPESYPVSWELDAAEAPGRVRVRLRRAHLALRPRFLLPDHQYKTELAEAASRSTAPLRSVTGGGGGLRGGLVARLQLHETVAHMARVTLVSAAQELPGELLLTDRCIHFVPDSLGCGGAEGEAQSWALEDVRHVATRRWCLQERAAELFLAAGRAHLLAFAGQPERAAFLAHTARHLPTRMEPETLSEAMALWRAGAITNWEYLMKLNGLAGRTYNDLMQYPILPFVIADYSSRILDLNDPATFRDLSKPMAIQNKSREQHYINTYNDLKAARREGCGALASREPHHYASLYSNPGCVLHYLVRLPPFTQLLLQYQDNNFDMPDRTFHSLATTWRLITNDSPTDVKELIPELFYLPELFQNTEGLNLGIRQCGAAVDAVELPPWAADARLFTLIHRQALEAPLVTERLPHWIDLVFGYKQTGQPAIDAVNVFPHCTYYGFDPECMEDEVERTAAAAMVRTYGQAPRQLLRAPHPHRAPDLAPAQDAQPGVWAGVEGARWGRYCGSPALGAVRVALRRALPAARLAALPDRAPAAAAAPPHTALLLLPAAHGQHTQCYSRALPAARLAALPDRAPAAAAAPPHTALLLLPAAHGQHTQCYSRALPAARLAALPDRAPAAAAAPPHTALLLLPAAHGQHTQCYSRALPAARLAALPDRAPAAAAAPPHTALLLLPAAHGQHTQCYSRALPAARLAALPDRAPAAAAAPPHTALLLLPAAHGQHTQCYSRALPAARLAALPDRAPAAAAAPPHTALLLLPAAHGQHTQCYSRALPAARLAALPDRAPAAAAAPPHTALLLLPAAHGQHTQCYSRALPAARLAALPDRAPAAAAAPPHTALLLLPAAHGQHTQCYSRALPAARLAALPDRAPAAAAAPPHTALLLLPAAHGQHTQCYSRALPAARLAALPDRAPAAAAAPPHTALLLLPAAHGQHTQCYSRALPAARLAALPDRAPAAAAAPPHTALLLLPAAHGQHTQCYSRALPAARLAALPDRAPAAAAAPPHTALLLLPAAHGQHTQCYSRALPAARLAALPDRAPAAAAAPPHTALLLLPAAHGETGATGGGAGLALLSWGHSDGVVRLKRRRDAPLEPVLRVPPPDQITAVACAVSVSSCPVVLGHRSGRVVALRARRGAGGGAALHARCLPLHAHCAPVVGAHAAVPAGLLVTASSDGLIVLWDLDKLTYIRTLPNRDMLPVTHVTISETLCDVASVHDVTAPPAAPGPAPAPAPASADDDSYEKDAENYKSLIRVHTVNARFVGSVKVAECVTSVCYSNAPEGVSVNVVACGLRSGAVRLYSAWDLRPLATVPPAHAKPAKPLAVISLTYSTDNEVLFGCYADGTVVAWHSGAARPAVSVLPAHALF